MTTTPRELLVGSPRQRHQPEQPRQPIPRIIPWEEWLELRRISDGTGRRLRKAGKVKVTQLSPRRIGVREDHDREFLESCLVPPPAKGDGGAS
jgi:hypothetical protein